MPFEWLVIERETESEGGGGVGWREHNLTIYLFIEKPFAGSQKHIPADLIRSIRCAAIERLSQP